MLRLECFSVQSGTAGASDPDIFRRSQARSKARKIVNSWGKQAMIMDRIALILTVIGALNWGSVGLFKFDLVAWICGGQTALLSRIIYTVVALAGIWCISLIFRSRESFDRIED
jgi:uncharacterized membrane protein YuzA (DUF378 family)